MRSSKYLTIFCTLLAFIAASMNTACQSEKPAVADAEKFISGAEKLLEKLSTKYARASWVQANFITEDTEIIASEANQDYIEATTKLAEEVKK